MIIDDKVYGRQEIDDPLILEIIATPEMQRLKGVNQYGIWNLFNERYFTSRFDHCVGVYLLLHHFGASREEQTAGLMHDIAHTAFSHVIDYVFDDSATQTVHETFHTRVIFNSEIPNILRKYGLDVERLVDEHNFGILERALPDLCADRVDYFLRDSLLLEKCSREEVRMILGALNVYEQELMLTDKDTAEMMEGRFRQMCLDFWGPPIQTGSYTLMANILREALEKEIIDETDFFSTDENVLKKLHDSLDANIVHQLQLFSTDKIVEGTAEEHTFHNRSKARYINPKVFVEGKIIRTTDFVPGLQDKLEEFIEKYKEGYYIKIIE
ncbi:HD domain-containing protein [Candidatus Woesearchaeota archaeon]|nr:HD domain-containing protein [Candidatus Woesearchaeota archaeon]